MAGSLIPTTAGLTATAKISDISATTVTIDSSTQVTLTFENGIGLGTDLPLSELVFSDGKRASISDAAKLT